jgi:hypothetical protein
MPNKKILFLLKLILLSVTAFANAEDIKEYKFKMIPYEVAKTEGKEVIIENGVFESDLIIRSDGTAKIGAQDCKSVFSTTILCLHMGTGSFTTVDLKKMRYTTSSTMDLGEMHLSTLELGILRHAD